MKPCVPAARPVTEVSRHAIVVVGNSLVSGSMTSGFSAVAACV